MFSCTEEKKIVPGIVFNFFFSSCYCEKANLCAFYSHFTEGVDFFFSITETKCFFLFLPDPLIAFWEEGMGGDV